MYTYVYEGRKGPICKECQCTVRDVPSRSDDATDVELGKESLTGTKWEIAPSKSLVVIESFLILVGSSSSTLVGRGAMAATIAFVMHLWVTTDVKKADSS